MSQTAGVLPLSLVFSDRGAGVAVATLAPIEFQDVLPSDAGLSALGRGSTASSGGTTFLSILRGERWPLSRPVGMTSRPSPLTVVEKGKEAVAASASFGNQAAWAAAPHAFLGDSQGSGSACLGIPHFGVSSSAAVNQRTGDG
jgi:hypothetical protein